MKEITYHITERVQRRKITSVVLLKVADIIVRGTAICHKSDKFNTDLGFTIARGRALKALVQRKTCKANKIKRSYAIKYTPTIFTSKCEFDPILSAHEKKLLK